MAYNFRGGDRDQQFLMPPNVAEWLPEGHLAWFVIDTVSELDLSEFYRRYRSDGRGGAAYEPATMVALLIYAYCVGDRSSRLIERRLVEDVAYRVVTANEQPDHATIARFRAEHETAIESLFGDVLGLCAAAGMVRVGLVALDGTKIGADASGAANMNDERLRRAIEAEVARIMAEAAAIDAAEDELYGAARGDELPPELADRSTRLARLREAKARLEAARAARDSAAETDSPRREPDAAASSKRRTPKPTKAPSGDQKPLLINATDPDSRLQKIPGGFCQGYNAQAIATQDQVLIAAELTASTVDVHQLAPLLGAASENLETLGVFEPIAILVADAGYYSSDNATLDTDTELLIATAKAHKLPTEPPAPPAAIGEERDELDRAKRIAAVFARVEAGDITMYQAATELALSGPWTYQLRGRWRQAGAAGLLRKRRANGEGNKARAAAVIRYRLEARLASDEGRALYRRRSQIIEPVFGQIKGARGMRRFQRRGLIACASEWKLIAATHNLLKLWRHRSLNLVAAL